MSGDLSLSGALGGLRIANPDDSNIASPTSPTYNDSAVLSPPPTMGSQSSNDTVTPTSSNLLPTLSQDTSGETGGVLGFNPDSYTLQNGGHSPASSHHSRSPTTPQVDTFPRAQRLNHRQSMPMAHQAQQQMQYPSYGSDSNQQFRHPSAQGIQTTRPVSGMYQLPNTSSSSNRSYGYRDDMGSSDGSASGLARTGSSRRASPGMMAAGVPSRDSSRTYRQGGQQVNGGNGPLPPRRNSRRVRAPTNGSGNGYDASMYGSSAPTPSNAEDWRDKGAAVGTRQETDASGQVQTRVVKKGVKDFNFGRTLGEGSYSTVLAATDRQTSKEYAIKVLDKRHIIKEKKVKYVNIERDTLNRLTEHPGIVRLYYTFQDERSLYFVLDLATGGELLGTLKKMGTFDLECSRFYSAQILDSVSYMHSRGIIHRDLKPENVLLDREMHTKITDFGTAKILPDPKMSGAAVAGDPTDGSETDRAVSFVGTAEYVSPELLRDKNACKASDLWAFGCIVYQLIAGRPPFKAANEYLTFQKILSLEYSFPDGFPPVARDLIERLLVLEPANRLPVEHIKSHAFFDGIPWGKSLWRQKAPRLKPYVPPATEPIKLNGVSQQRSNNSASYAPPVQAASQVHINSQQRPQLRGITELPPPSQLDIDWSPVLTGNNERILKLGNLNVMSGPALNSNSPGGSIGADPTTPSDKPKFRSFFSSSGNGKKKERLVLITSKGRVIVCAAGGNDKRIKTEISLLAGSWKSFVDAKGLTGWQYDNREKHFTFEDPRGTTMDPSGSKFSTQEWLETVENAREIAESTPSSQFQSYSNDSFGNPDDGFGGDAATPPHVGGGGHPHHMKHTLRKAATEDETGRGMGGLGRKRFSKRHSKSGLAAVF